jgi:hypothetical protein
VIVYNDGTHSWNDRSMNDYVHSYVSNHSWNDHSMNGYVQSYVHDGDIKGEDSVKI